MSTNLFAFYAACTALLLFALAALVVPLLRRGRGGRAAPDAVSAQVAVYRDELRELEREVAAGTLTHEQFASARREIETRLAEDIKAVPAPAQAGGHTARNLRSRSRNSFGIVAAATAVIVAGGSWWLYARLGTPLAIEETGRSPSGAVSAKADAGARAPLPSMEVLTQRLAMKMRTQTPDDGEGWALLARSYVELKQYREAADAFAQAAKRIPNDATLLADYADALGMANGKTLRGEPAALAQRALKADPKHPKALALAASAAFEGKKYREAIGYWERLGAVLAPGSDEARGVEANIAEAQALLGGKTPVAAAALEVQADAGEPKDASITGTVRVAPELAAKMSSGDTLFIYARALTGPAMPLAIVRAKAAELPFTFRLDDSQAMLPDLRLSRVSDVALTARVSQRGAATPEKGDLQGSVQPVKVGTRGIDLVIDQVVR
jgi:cytochrome c-type biogenesis protein CcmH